MVRWLVLFLIALLPVRGWVGDAMAGEMLGQHLRVVAPDTAQPSPVAAHGHVMHGMTDHGADHDCSHHGDLTTGSAQPASSAQAPADDCATCASCQACSALALVFDTATPAVAAAPSAAPQWAGHGYPSADRNPAFKPPIS